MGYRIRPVQLRSDLEAYNNELRDSLSNFGPVKTAINGYISSNMELMGNTFLRHQNFFQVEHFAVINREEGALESLISANERHIALVDGLGYDGLLDQDHLENAISRLNGHITQSNRAIRAIEDYCWASGSDNSRFLRDLVAGQEDLRDYYQDKLDKLLEFARASRNLYNSVQSELSNVKNVLLRLEQSSFDPVTGEIIIPSLDEAIYLEFNNVLIQAAYDRLRKENGDPNWDVIREILDRPLEDISDAELVAVAMLLDGLEDEQLPRFFGYLANEFDSFSIGMNDLGQPVPGELGSFLHSTDYTAWEFCLDTANILQGLMALLPDNGYAGRREQRQAILSTLAQMTAPEPGVLDRRNLITSRYGQRPDITIVPEYFESGTRRDLRITVPTIRTRLDPDVAGFYAGSTSRHKDGHLRRTWHGVGESSFRVTPVMRSSVALNEVSDHLDRFHSDAFAVSGIGAAADVLGGEALGAVVAAATKGAAPVLMIAINTMRAASDASEKIGNLNLANSITDANRQVTLTVDFPLNSALVLHDDGPAVVHLHPIPDETQLFVEAINDSGHFDNTLFDGDLTEALLVSESLTVNSWWNDVGEPVRTEIEDDFDELREAN